MRRTACFARALPYADSLAVFVVVVVVDVVVDVGEVQLSQPLADCTTEREGTSVPVVISRSFGSRVRRGKTTAAERMSVTASAAAEGFLSDSRVFVNEEIVVDRVRTRSLSVLS